MKRRLVMNYILKHVLMVDVLACASQLVNSRQNIILLNISPDFSSSRMVHYG